MELEWKNFAGFTTLQILAEIQNMMTEVQCELEQFPGRIIFMSMYNDIVWGEKGNKEVRIANSENVAEYPRRFVHGHWSILGPGSEKKRYGTQTYKPNGEWDRVVEDLLINVSESGIPYSVDPLLWNEQLRKVKEKENCLYISVVMTVQPKCFFAESFPSISSVFSEK